MKMVFRGMGCLMPPESSTKGVMMMFGIVRLSFLVLLYVIIMGCGGSKTTYTYGGGQPSNSSGQLGNIESLFANIESLLVIFEGPPDTPTSLKAAAARSSVRLDWSSSEKASGYNVYRNGSKITSVASPSYLDTGLTTGETYSYAVSAFNNAGESQRCSAINVTTAVWTKLLGTDKNEAGWAVALDSSGNMYIAGETDGNLGGHINAGRTDIFLAKYDSTGTMQWVQLLGTAWRDRAYGVAVDSSGDVVLAGSVQDPIEGQPYAGGNDIVIAKYDASGTRQWVRLLGTSGSDVASAVAVDSSCNIYITGSASGGIDGETYMGGSDIVIAKYDMSGTKQWVRLLGSAMSDQGNGIAVDSSGNVTVTGYAGGSIDGEAYSGNTDSVITRYDSSGTRQWTRLFGTSSTDKGNGIALDSSGNALVTGVTNGNLDGLANMGMIDIFIVKYDTSGMRQWSRLLGTTDNDGGSGVSLDSSGNIFITGYTRGNLDGNTFAGGWGDIFVAKYDKAGAKQWVNLLGTSSEEWGCGIAVDSAGDAVFTGYTYGNLDGLVNSGYNSNPILGTRDSFLAKIGSSGVLW